MVVFNNSVVQVQVCEMLYRFALECAEHKIRNTCDSICKECPSNIELYGLNKREAMLLQHTVELEMQHRFKLQHELRMNELVYYNKIRHENNVSKAMGIMWPVVIAFLVLLFFNLFIRNPAPQQAQTPPPDFVDHIGAIVETLDRIYKTDMNGDGLINCIDYTIQFYNAYPTRSDIRIVVTHNYKADFHHLFVYVRGIAIEPAAFVSPRGDDNESKIGVIDYWGPVLYNPKYDTDVTVYWTEIRTNKYRW